MRGHDEQTTHMFSYLSPEQRVPANHPLRAVRALTDEAADVTPSRRPARAPNLNAYTERFVRTIKDSCLERLVLIGEGSRRRAVREFVAHYHHERNHQGLDNRLILPLSTAPPPRGRVQCRQRLGGMLNYYYRSAA